MGPGKLRILFLLFFLFPLALRGQGAFSLFNGRNHPELRWQILESDHFRVIFHQRLDSLAKECAAVAEACYAPICENLQHRPQSKIPIYLTDQDDISNGFTVADRYIGIWVNVNGYMEWSSGEDKWLRKVIAHELVHYVHFSALRTPLGLLGQSFSGTPTWFIEGLAQYESETWNVLRGDLLLRVSVWDDVLDTDGENWPTNGPLIYAIGNSRVRYLAERYGDSSLVKLINHRKHFLGIPYYDFVAAFRAAFNESEAKVLQDWHRRINVCYNTIYGQKELPLEAVDNIDLPMLFIDGLDVSADRQWLALVGILNANTVYRSLVRMRNDSTKAMQVLAQGEISAQVSFSPDGSSIAFSRLRRGCNGSLMRDLYVSDPHGNLVRLTSDCNAVDPDWSPDGRRLVFVDEQNGQSNLYIIDAAGGRPQQLTDLNGDVQLLSPRWSPDGKRIAVSLFDAQGNRDIALVDSCGLVKPLLRDRDDDRLPTWSPQGDQIVFVSYRNGSPNLFRLPITKPDSLSLITDIAGSVTRPVWRGDSLYAILSDSRKRDQLVRLDANRFVDLRQTSVDSHFTAWMHKQPPAGLPPLAPDGIDPVATESSGPYYSFRHLRHVLTLPIPVAANDGAGLFAMSLFAEPLGKHLLSAAAFIDAADIAQSQFFLNYLNRCTFADVALSGFRLPASGQIWDGRALVEEARGARLDVQWPLALGDQPFDRALVGGHAEWSQNRVLNKKDFLDTQIVPAEKQIGECGFFALYRRKPPDLRNTWNPQSGFGALVQMRFSDKNWGSELFYRRLTANTYAILPLPLAEHVFFIHTKADGVSGETLAQDFVGLDRDDQPDFGKGLRFVDRDRVRGFRRFRIGDRLLFASAEYRLPLLPDLGWNIAGFSFRETSLTGFFDTATVWWADSTSWRKTGWDRSVGWEIKNRVSMAGFDFVHAFGMAWPLIDTGENEKYYRLRAVIPF